jgi:hypothetical protein
MQDEKNKNNKTYEIRYQKTGNGTYFEKSNWKLIIVLYEGKNSTTCTNDKTVFNEFCRKETETKVGKW